MQDLTARPVPSDPGYPQIAEPPMSSPQISAFARGVLLLTVLTSGLSAGLFYIFEAAITPGLAIVSDRTYIEAFQGINAIIRNLPFGVAFFGPIVLAAVAVRLLRHNRRMMWLVAAGLAVYVIGVLGVTFGFHVPRNEELATYSNLATTDLSAVRRRFEGPWNSLNLVRTVAACASFALFSFALLIVAAPRR